MENVGYGLGALANASDIYSLSIGGTEEVQVNTEHTDWKGHSSISDVGESDPLVSVGPQGDDKVFKVTNANENWPTYADKPNSTTWKTTVKGVSRAKILNYSTTKYNPVCFNCASHTARALTIAGSPTIGGHPYIVYLQTTGVRPWTFSYTFYD